MTDHAALLAAVLESPDNDVPRLLMADWFRDNGQWERGEFIAVQCELARIESWWLKENEGKPVPSGHPYWHYKHIDLRAHERELTPFITIDGVSAALSGEFRRGFLHTIRTTAAEWQRETHDFREMMQTGFINRMTIGQSILRQQPVVRVEFADNNAIEIAHELRDDRPPWCLSWFYNDPVCLSAYCPTRAALIDIMPAQLREWGVSEVVPFTGRIYTREALDRAVANFNASVATPPPRSISPATGRS